MPINNYIRVNNIIANLNPPDNQVPQYEIDYDVFLKPFNFTNKNLVFSGTMIGAASVGDDANTVMEKGRAEVAGKLCELVSYAVDRKQYAMIDETSSNFKFILCNNRGVEIGRSIGKSFNNIVTAEIDFLSPKQIQLGTFGTFGMRNAINRGLEVEVQLKETPDPEAIEEQLSYVQSFAIETIDLENRSLKINANIADDPIRFYIGDSITITDSKSNNGIYTIRAVEESGTSAMLYLNEAIPVDEISGMINIRRAYPITRIIGKKVFIKGGEEERKIGSLIDFFTKKFMSHEGFHLIEHTILRPRIKEPGFVPATREMLESSIEDLGFLFFRNTKNIDSVNAARNLIFVKGDLTKEKMLKRIKISGDSPNDGDYRVESMEFRKGKTIIKVKENIIFSLPAPGLKKGIINIYKRTAINRLTATSRKIRVAHPDVLKIPKDDRVAIWKSTDKLNDGEYKITSVKRATGGSIEISIGQKEIFLEDTLLPVYFDTEECESCNIIDPYSCIVSVVLPFWPGRFTNLDIRKHIEKTIRLEAPAHLLNEDLTSSDRFFVRNNGIPPELNSINLEKWTLTIEGESAKQTKSYTLKDLKTK